MMWFLPILLMATPTSLDGPSSAPSSNPTGQCIFGKADTYSKRPETAEVLAQLIASECSELLSQGSDKDCGAAQARCDAIIEERNENIRTGMVRFAYRAIVMLRQSR